MWRPMLRMRKDPYALDLHSPAECSPLSSQLPIDWVLGEQQMKLGTLTLLLVIVPLHSHFHV